jgi:hypothetical protein
MRVEGLNLAGLTDQGNDLPVVRVNVLLPLRVNDLQVVREIDLQQGPGEELQTETESSLQQWVVQQAQIKWLRNFICGTLFFVQMKAQELQLNGQTSFRLSARANHMGYPAS